jgi:hypothetical protein
MVTDHGLVEVKAQERAQLTERVGRLPDEVFIVELVIELVAQHRPI